jgi:pimeloyl-ACP methyl ester carboxylesterase
VLLQHFMGNLDNYDPAITDHLATDREVILTDNAGVGLSTGTAPQTVAGMARDAASLIDALGLTHVDLFGFSMGGFVAQQITVDRPELVRRLILVGTGPRGGEGMGQARPGRRPALRDDPRPAGSRCGCRSSSRHRRTARPQGAASSVLCVFDWLFMAGS